MTMDELINRLGGIVEMADSLGHPHATTVRYWRSREGIPRWRVPEVVALCRKHRLGIDETDLPVIARKAA
jgi:hypothetical protein